MAKDRDTTPPARPGEGIEWKVGTEVVLEKVGRAESTTLPAWISKVGRRWIYVDYSTATDAEPDRRTEFYVRFDRGTGLAEGYSERYAKYRLWASLDAIDRYASRETKVAAIRYWRHSYLRFEEWSTFMVERLHAVLVELGEIKSEPEA